MCLTTLLLLICVSVLLLNMYRQFSRPQNFPPGPAGLPLVGNCFDVKKLIRHEKYMHKTFEVLSQMYKSSILGLRLGNSLTVIVSSSEHIHQVLTKEDFEGRPDTFFIRLRSMGTRRGITCTDGALWHEQRSFVLRHLRNLGYGKHNMEMILHEELAHLTKKMEEQAYDHNIKIGPHIAKSVLDVLYTLVAGSRLSSSNFYLDKVLKLLDKRNRLFDMSGGLLNHAPWLRFVAPNFTGYNLIKDINSELKSLFQEVIAEHEETYSPLETRDLIDAFLHRMKENKLETNSDFYTEDQLIMVCLDLFIAGSQSTSNTLDFAFLVMILNQDIQRKVRKEIWSTLGSERFPSLGDRTSLPYVEAVLMEIYRLCHVTPLIGPRRAVRDTTLNGYAIPKNTTILINVNSVHMDKQYWKDPEEFRPERFLDAAGNLKADEHLLPFGLGRRRCLGETLARSCIFIFFTGLLQRFHLQPVPDEQPSITPLPGILMAPQPYHVMVTLAEKLA